MDKKHWADGQFHEVYKMKSPFENLNRAAIRASISMESERSKYDRSYDVLKGEQEEEELTKRNQEVQIQHEQREVENLMKINDLVTTIMNKLFKRMDNYHEEYVKNKKFIVSEKKAESSATNDIGNIKGNEKK